MINQKGDFLFTSESVTEGHPDKICDQVSDAILDAIYKDDPDARVAIECLTKTGSIMIGGEVTTKTYVDMAEIARERSEPGTPYKEDYEYLGIPFMADETSWFHKSVSLPTQIAKYPT